MDFADLEIPETVGGRVNQAEQAAAAFEEATFQVVKVGAKEKAGSDPVGFVEFKCSGAKGTSKLMLFGEECLMTEYKVGEFYKMELNMVKAQPQSHDTGK